MEKEKYLTESNLDILSEMEKIEVLGGIGESGNRDNTGCSYDNCSNNNCNNTKCSNAPCSNINGCHDKDCVNGWPIFENCG